MLSPPDPVLPVLTSEALRGTQGSARAGAGTGGPCPKGSGGPGGAQPDAAPLAGVPHRLLVRRAGPRGRACFFPGGVVLPGWTWQMGCQQCGAARTTPMPQTVLQICGATFEQQWNRCFRFVNNKQKHGSGFPIILCFGGIPKFQKQFVSVKSHPDGPFRLMPFYA